MSVALSQGNNSQSEMLLEAALQRRPVVYELAAHSIFSAQGADTVRYLHGRLTQDIKSLASGAATQSLILSPQGKVLGKLTLLREREQFLILSDPLATAAAQEEFVAALLKFKVSDDIAIVPEEKRLVAFFLVGLDSTVAREAVTGSGIAVAFSLGNVTGSLLLTTRECGGALRETLSAKIAEGELLHGDADAYELLRIAQRIPQFPDDFPAPVLAPDIDLTHYVSFTKGCYAGQEVIEMATARGRPARRFAAFSAKGQPSSGVNIVASTINDTDGKSSGFITSAAYLPARNETLLLGFVKTATEQGAILFCTGLSSEPVALNWR
jgi:aminomethyltransferase